MVIEQLPSTLERLVSRFEFREANDFGDPRGQSRRKGRVSNAIFDLALRIA